MSPQLLKSLKKLSELPITVDILVVRAVKSLGLFMVSVESQGELFSREVLLSLEQGVLRQPPAPPSATGVIVIRFWKCQARGRSVPGQVGSHGGHFVTVCSPKSLTPVWDVRVGADPSNNKSAGNEEVIILTVFNGFCSSNLPALMVNTHFGY